MNISKVIEKAIKKNKWQVIEKADGGIAVNGDKISGGVLVESLTQEKIYLILSEEEILSEKRDNVIRLKSEVFKDLGFYIDKEEAKKSFNDFKGFVNDELTLIFPDTSKLTLNEKIEWQSEHSGSRFAERIEGDIQEQFNILKTDDELYFFADEVGGNSEAEQKDYWEKNLSKYKPISERNKENYKGLKKYFDREPSKYAFFEGYNPPWVKRIMNELVSERRQLEKATANEEDAYHKKSIKKFYDKHINTEGATVVARLRVNQALSEVLNNELSYVDATYTDPMIESLYCEKTALEQILQKKNIDCNKETSNYDELENLIKEYADRLHIPEQYGWDKDDIIYSIKNNLYMITTEKKTDKALSPELINLLSNLSSSSQIKPKEAGNEVAKVKVRE